MRLHQTDLELEVTLAIIFASLRKSSDRRDWYWVILKSGGVERARALDEQ
jgi:hypothetical protein